MSGKKSEKIKVIQIALKTKCQTTDFYFLYIFFILQRLQKKPTNTTKTKKQIDNLEIIVLTTNFEYVNWLPDRVMLVKNMPGTTLQFKSTDNHLLVFGMLLWHWWICCCRNRLLISSLLAYGYLKHPVPCSTEMKIFCHFSLNKLFWSLNSCSNLTEISSKLYEGFCMQTSDLSLLKDGKFSVDLSL